MKRTLLVPIGLLLVIGAVIAVAAWEPWRSHEREHEVDWLTAYAAWSDRIDAGLADGDNAPGANCEKAYAEEVGKPPPRLAPAARIALSGCRQLQHALDDSVPSVGGSEWHGVRNAILVDLTDRRTRASAPDRSPELAAQAAPLAAEDPEVLCWSSTNWEELSEEWRLIRVDELWPIGFADLQGGRIHLAPQICGPLHRFFGGDYAPSLNLQSLELAIALVTLAHEAEHLRSPAATEAQVECVAIQRVRDLVRSAGRSASYEDLMTGLAWDVGYPNVPPSYRTAECHDGSELDVRPNTSEWP